jgi:hypothetical protein
MRQLRQFFGRLNQPFKYLKYFAPSSPSTTSTPYRIIEELNLCTPGGFHRVSLSDTFNSGRYAVLRKLGYGLYSTVWLARDAEYVEASLCPSKLYMLI